MNNDDAIGCDVNWIRVGGDGEAGCCQLAGRLVGCGQGQQRARASERVWKDDE